MSATIKGMAALQIHLGKMDGVEFEKKITRFNDISAMCELYAKCGDCSPESCLNEVIEFCVVGSAFHIKGKRISESISEYRWMERPHTHFCLHNMPEAVK